MSVEYQFKFLCQNSLCDKNNILKRNDEKDDILERDNWAERYTCDKCNAVFYSCKSCNKEEMNQNLFYRSRLSRHHQKHLNNDIIVHRKKENQI